MRPKPHIGLVFIALAIALSFLRENTFLIINGVINGTGSYKANVVPPLWLTTNFTTQELLALKWPATALFIIAFIAITLIALNLSFRNRSFLVIVAGIYILLLLFGALIMVTGHFMNQWNNFFPYTQRTFSFIQSPLLLIIAYASFYGFNNIDEKK